MDPPLLPFRTETPPGFRLLPHLAVNGDRHEQIDDPDREQRRPVADRDKHAALVAEHCDYPREDNPEERRGARPNHTYPDKTRQDKTRSRWYPGGWCRRRTEQPRQSNHTHVDHMHTVQHSTHTQHTRTQSIAHASHRTAHGSAHNKPAHSAQLVALACFAQLGSA